MPVHNSEIATIFEHVADLLESRALEDMQKDSEDLSELPDIGEDLAAKIDEILRTGKLSFLREIADEVSEAIVSHRDLSVLFRDLAQRLPTVAPFNFIGLIHKLGFQNQGIFSLLFCPF